MTRRTTPQGSARPGAWGPTPPVRWALQWHAPHGGAPPPPPCWGTGSGRGLQHEGSGLGRRGPRSSTIKCHEVRRAARTAKGLPSPPLSGTFRPPWQRSGGGGPNAVDRPLWRPHTLSPTPPQPWPWPRSERPFQRVSVTRHYGRGPIAPSPHRPTAPAPAPAPALVSVIATGVGASATPLAPVTMQHEGRPPWGRHPPPPPHTHIRTQTLRGQGGCRPQQEGPQQSRGFWGIRGKGEGHGRQMGGRQTGLRPMGGGGRACAADDEMGHGVWAAVHCDAAARHGTGGGGGGCAWGSHVRVPVPLDVPPPFPRDAPGGTGGQIDREEREGRGWSARPAPV